MNVDQLMRLYAELFLAEQEARMRLEEELPPELLRLLEHIEDQVERG